MMNDSSSAGNAETNNLDTGNGHMEAIYYGTNTIWGTGAGNGPWLMADLENGLFSGVNVKQTPTIPPSPTASSPPSSRASPTTGLYEAVMPLRGASPPTTTASDPMPMGTTR